MTKAYSIVSGIAAGLFSVLVLTKYILFMTAIPYIIYSDFKGTAFHVPAVIFFILVPIIFCMIITEISSILIRKTGNDSFRIAAILFSLINIGYIIITGALGIISVLLQKDFGSVWHSVLLTTGLGYNQRLNIVVVIMVLLFGYLNVSTKRFRKNIPVIKT